MNINTRTLFSCLFIFVLTLFSCGTRKAYYAKSEINWKTANSPDSLHLKYSVFLIGDVGKPDTLKQEPTLKLLQQQIYYRDAAAQNSTENTSRKEDVVIFLGDNIYETGLPLPDASDRRLKERRIIEQMNVVKGMKGRAIFVPGNHDWNESRPGGLAAIQREEAFIEAYLDSTDVFQPSNGCSGPVEIQLNNDLVVIVLDSEWWLHKYDKPFAPDNDCNASSRLEVIQQVQDIVLRNRGKNIVLAEHHPLFSNGTHGGYYTLKDYLFPLTLVRDNMYIPLPIIGAVYPLMRQYGVSRQDLANKDYQQLKRGLLSILSEEKNVVFAAGHEHALQFNKYNDLNHIISGAGSKSSSLIKGNGALFAHGTMGFSRLNYYDNGQCWVEFWEPEGDGSTGKLVYRAPLYAIAPKSVKAKQEEKNFSYKDSSKVIAAGRQYKAGEFKRSVFGEHYRDSWATPVKVPYLDLTTFGGGLTPVKMGGGNQTVSLQLQGKDGTLYQFRAIDKDPSKLLPEGFSKTLAEDILQDQISSAHPYGALIVPEMAKTIGIYYAAPKLVYMPYSSLLGPYIQQVGGKMGFIEARPDEDVSAIKSFGNAKNAISTKKLYEKLRDDNDNDVDQKMFLRARLFDMLIGDWDRHEDQWRWAEFKKEKSILYRPIPRDRDQAFVKYDGLFPRVVSKLNPYFQSFERKITDPANLGIGARDLDRNLLNQLSKEEWLGIAADIQARLSDQVIETAVKQMPPEVYNISGATIAKNLKLRRDHLIKTAKQYYDVLSKEVTIVGSDKNEFIHVQRNGKLTRVQIYKINKEDKVDHLMFDRTFTNSETSFIDIYALDGKDSVVVEGKSSGPIKLRIVGGKGNDIVNTGNENRITYYDNTDNYKLVDNSSPSLITSKRDWVNDYQAIGWFNYDESSPIPSLDYNSDDGIFLGAGYHRKHYSFKKEPFAYEHTLVGNYAPKTNSITLRYVGDFKSVLARNTDILVGGLYRGPQYTFNYFGEGNSTTYNDNEIDSYRIRSRSFISALFFQHRFTQAFRVGIGPGFEYYDILKTPGRFVSQPAFLEAAQIASPSRIGVVRSYADINFVDDDVFPTSGVRWRNEVNFFNSFTGSKDHHFQLKSDVSFYATPNLNFPVTYALRLGGATNIGDYSFFQANSLGNNVNLSILGQPSLLRGYRNNRFTGRSFLYQNSEFRFRVASLRNYIFTGDLGLIGFFDAGRVYSDQAESGKWHTGYGPGIWINLFRKFIVTGSYGFSSEAQVFSFKTGITF